MGRGIGKTLFAAAGILTALTGLSGFGFADFVMSGGKRQTLAEARKWQEDHYDISWYDSLQKEEYVVEGFEGYALHTVLCKNPVQSGKYVILTHGYSDNRFGSLKYMKIYLDRGYHCIIYDLRGHGENEKTWTSYGVREGRDLVRLIEDTRKRYDTIEVLGLHGESLGGASTVSALGHTQDVDFAVVNGNYAIEAGLGDAIGVINTYAVDGCMPDMTILLRLDPAKGSSRIADREHDRIEQASDAFHKKVYEGYLKLEERYPDRIIGIDASGTINEIAEEISRRVKEMMNRGSL